MNYNRKDMTKEHVKIYLALHISDKCEIERTLVNEFVIL